MNSLDFRRFWAGNRDTFGTLDGRDGSIDVKERHIRPSKVPYFRAFRAFFRQRRRAKITAKNALTEHINCFCRRVEYNELLIVYYNAQKENNKYTNYDTEHLKDCIDHALWFMRISRNPRKLIYYSRYLVEKADFLIRTTSGSRKEIEKALEIARKSVNNNALPYSEAKYKLLLAEASYYTYVQKDFVRAVGYMVEAINASRGKFHSQLDFIDNILIPNINLFREHKEFFLAEKYLRDFISVCDKKREVAPYERKKKKLEALLSDIQSEQTG